MIKKFKIFALCASDIIFIQLCYLLALHLRFEGNIEPQYLNNYINQIIALTVIKISVFSYFKLYKSLYRYAGINDLITIIMACLIGNMGAVTYLTIMQTPLPRSVYIIVGILDVFFIGGIRFSIRVLSKTDEFKSRLKREGKRVLIIGAGDAGAMIIREMKNHSELKSFPVAIIDDDTTKEGKSLIGVPIIGQREDIVSVVRKKQIDEIIIAVPSAGKKEIKKIVNECKQTKAKIRIVPGMYEVLDGTVNLEKVRDVDIRDVLGREEVLLDSNLIAKYIENEVVLVSGAGGSIGSELCRQISRFKPKQLIMLDIYENGVFELQNELKKIFPTMTYEVKIASVRDKKMMHEIVKRYQPAVIFHAAAHKHVPLMEANPKAAVKNNVFGTLNLAQAAHEHGVKRFVMISTDKAVNPTNIMGASKRLCEMIVQSLDKVSSTEFVAVRFGNVLGSNGSVIPIFKKQINDGGPVTVTHPEITRYFMTIPEASQLVLQAGALARGGEIFILDMGEPVKILNLAEDVIRLSGYEPYEDIQIVFSGLRPGEKLYEELLLAEEGMTKTPHEKIFVGKPSEIDFNSVFTQLEQFRESLIDMDDESVKEKMIEFVPTYQRTK